MGADKTKQLCSTAEEEWLLQISGACDAFADFLGLRVESQLADALGGRVEDIKLGYPFFGRYAQDGKVSAEGCLACWAEGRDVTERTVETAHL